jgi:hypothetical protein
MSEDGTNIESNMNDEKNNKKTIKDLFVELVRKS